MPVGRIKDADLFARACPKCGQFWSDLEQWVHDTRVIAEQPSAFKQLFIQERRHVGCGDRQPANSGVMLIAVTKRSDTAQAIARLDLGEIYSPGKKAR